MEEQVKREVLTQLKVKHRNLVRLHYYFEVLVNDSVVLRVFAFP